MTVEKKKNFLINILFIAVVFAMIYFGIKFLTVYLLPFAIGLLISLVAQKPVDYILNKTRIKRRVVAVAFVVVVYSIVCTLLFVVCYNVYVQLADFVLKLPDYIPVITAAFENLSASSFSILDNLPDNLSNLISDLPSHFLSSVAKYLGEFVPSFAGNIVKSFPQLLISTIVTVVASCYIANEYSHITKFLSETLPLRAVVCVKSIKRLFFENIFKIIRGYLLLMIITFAELSFGLGIIGVNNFIFISAIIALVDLFPILGTGTVLIPWAIIELVVNGNVFMCIALIILYVVITIVRNFLEPKIIGEQMGLHPLVTLIAMFIGLKLFGIIGMFGIPISLMIIIKLHNEGIITLFKKDKEEVNG